MQRSGRVVMEQEVQRQDARRGRPVAVFDYDGTCIDGQSGSLIATWLMLNGYLSPYSVVGLAWWGVRYKLHLPFRQERARELIFRDLGKREPSEVDRIMVTFHDEVLLPRYRKCATDEIARRRREGCLTLLVSATFDPIAREAAKYLDVDGYAATHMELDAQGHYTGRVLGDVTEGSIKVETAKELARACMNEQPCYLEYAYGDHHSDVELLASAEHPYVVSPGPTLKREARKRGWPILDWKRTWWR